MTLLKFMKRYWAHKTNNKNLLLLFNGWGCDPRIATALQCPNHDILLLSDYTTIQPDFLEDIHGYDDVKVIAWSFGVFIANHYLPQIPNLSRAIAVNGTVHPIDNQRGIPQPIFEGTLAQFNTDTRNKFFRRMVGGKRNLEQYATEMPLRSCDSQHMELAQFPTWANHLRTPISFLWSKVIIGTKDAIFPPINQQNAWQGYPVVELEQPHYIPFQYLIDTHL